MKIERREGFMSIDIADSHFFGKYETSPDGHFEIAFDSDGQFFLIKDGCVFLKGQADSQFEGKVSNCGDFALSASARSARLESTFIMLEKTGRKLFERKLRALLHNFDVSQSGRFAITQTAVSNGADSSQLILWSVDAAGELWRREWVAWASEYEFDESANTVSLIYPDVGQFRFSFDGHFVDEDRWSIEQLRVLGGRPLIQAVEQLAAEGRMQQHPEQVLAALEFALARSSSPDFRTMELSQ